VLTGAIALVIFVLFKGTDYLAISSDTSKFLGKKITTKFSRLQGKFHFKDRPCSF
jgi:hypothetical protein